VTFDIKESTVSGISRISTKAGGEIKINRGSLEINHIKINDKEFNFNRGTSIISLTPENNGEIEIHFEGTFRGGKLSGENYGIAESVISQRGISLTGIWYPVLDGLTNYRLKATLPKDYEAISEADVIEKNIIGNESEYLFFFPYPLDTVNFVASRQFEVSKDHYDDIDIFAYFFPEDRELARKYIKFTKAYLAMYENLLGPYPYKRFSVVENFLPTGYSMPTYTLLGSSIVALPFIVETSLGHEILHQWFGSSVYIDYATGNWAEGLTAYLSDHRYKAQNNRGWEYRKQILIDYRSYVTAEHDILLRDFRSRVDFASKAIGYGKATMVFHMLRNIIGDQAFFEALKYFINENRFRMASWDDLADSFEKIHGKDLQWYFSQWLHGMGLPKLDIYGFELKHIGSTFNLHFHINQKERIFQFTLPVQIYYGPEVTEHFLQINKMSNSFDIDLQKRPDKVVFDEKYDVARTIDQKEYPPVISGLIGVANLVVVLPPEGDDIYETVIERFRSRGATIMKAENTRVSDIKMSTAVILGANHPLVGKLYGSINSEHTGFFLLVKKNPWNSESVIGIMRGTSKNEVDAAFRKIFHYGKYTKLLFDNGQNTVKETAATERGVSVKLHEDIPVVDISKLESLTDVINGIADKKIIYVGEVHDVFAHHAVQLDIISGLHQKNKKIAIGMEMFQTPFQKSLDRFVNGKMGEREFLMESEYYKRWGFDYHLYKPILDFARSEKVPVIALNMRREIIDSVSNGGLESLSEEEKKEIPKGLDFSDSEYRSRLKEVFRIHNIGKDKDFSHFYQSQILWDEKMSQSIDTYLKANPAYKIIVLAGQGHLMYGSGIPKRTFRRNGHDYAIILIDAEVEKNIADYVVFPKAVEGISSPKLMIFISTEETGLAVSGFPDKSVSEKAGIKQGDILMYIDDTRIGSIDDIKIHLLYKTRGDKVIIKVLREENGKKEEIEIAVEL
jgi:uncharacterized iron-regulated protein